MSLELLTESNPGVRAAMPPGGKPAAGAPARASGLKGRGAMIAVPDCGPVPRRSRRRRCPSARRSPQTGGSGSPGRPASCVLDAVRALDRETRPSCGPSRTPRPPSNRASPRCCSRPWPPWRSIPRTRRGAGRGGHRRSSRACTPSPARPGPRRCSCPPISTRLTVRWLFPLFGARGVTGYARTRARGGAAPAARLRGLPGVHGPRHPRAGDRCRPSAPGRPPCCARPCSPGSGTRTWTSCSRRGTSRAAALAGVGHGRLPRPARRGGHPPARGHRTRCASRRGPCSAGFPSTW